jgi:hypothetical protein
MADVDYVGPFEYHAVVVNGWKVPYLSATPLPGGRVYLALDDRSAVELSLKDAEHLVPFIADAIAIAHGYTAHPSEDPEMSLAPTSLHPFRRMIALD